MKKALVLHLTKRKTVRILHWLAVLSKKCHSSGRVVLANRNIPNKQDFDDSTL